jgi:hypothetical protein
VENDPTPENSRHCALLQGINVTSEVSFTTGPLRRTCNHFPMAANIRGYTTVTMWGTRWMNRMLFFESATQLKKYFIKKGSSPKLP